ncbi:hypothetical protein WMY93_033890 [Mugilogobius chulae]|uniref:Uncharacterized protein n=1 Tax=Mugilogobius chulae TaxID=88201 RepID=A0AAW0MLD8_9GOBI
MKANTPEERQAEMLRAKESTKIWTREGRVWDFNEICRWCPHVASRRALLRELRRRGFLIQNDTADSGTTKADDPSTSAAELPASPLASSSSATEELPSEDQPTQHWREFKQHLSAVLQIPNCQQEVDNVSRVLRYIQPTGEDINLDFLDNTTVLFLKLSRGATDLSIVQKCQHYQEFLTVLRKPISKSHSKDLIFGRFLSGEDVTEEEKTRYRYYCEAILIFGHFQRPGAVEGLTVTEWFRGKHQRRVVVAVKSHKTANSQVAPFALTEEEAALINQYFLSIRSDHVYDSDSLIQRGSSWPRMENPSQCHQ